MASNDLSRCSRAGFPLTNSVRPLACAHVLHLLLSQASEEVPLEQLKAETHSGKGLPDDVFGGFRGMRIAVPAEHRVRMPGAVPG